jgi:putative transposase
VFSERSDRLRHREITGRALDVRCRAPEATAVIDRAAAMRGIQPGQLTHGTNNERRHLPQSSVPASKITHRRGGYRDPESQAFIESRFSKLKLRCI